MFDLSNEWGQLTAKLLSEMTLKKKSAPPKVFMGALFNFYSKDMTMGTKPKTMLEYVAQNIVAQLIVKKKIKCTGSRLIKDLPIKNTNVYEHGYETEDGKEFYAYQVGFAPINSVEQLTYSILEMKKTSGCLACNFKGFVEDEIECPVCRNGLVRKVIKEAKNTKTFREFGWNIFSETVGQENANILEEFADEYHRFYSNFSDYLDEAKKLAASYMQENNLGEHYGTEIEKQLLVSFSIEDEDEDEDDEEDSQDYE